MGALVRRRRLRAVGALGVFSPGRLRPVIGISSMNMKGESAARPYLILLTGHGGRSEGLALNRTGTTD